MIKDRYKINRKLTNVSKCLLNKKKERKNNIYIYIYIYIYIHIYVYIYTAV